MKHMNESNDVLKTNEVEPIAGLSALKLERLPASDLWPGIESRVRAQKIRRWRTPLWGAAALAASLTLVLGLTVLHGQKTGTPLHAPATLAASQLAEDTSGDPRLIAVSNRPMHAETRALVRANLKIISTAERDIRQALEQDPQGEYLKNLLAAAQTQKQELRVTLASNDR